MTEAADDQVDAEAFKRLYPVEYYERFLEQSVRPDGRPLGRSRPTTINVDVVSTADSSALVKLGNTTVLAGVKAEVMAPPDDAPDQGQVSVQVEFAPLCSPDTRPGRRPDEAQVLTERLSALLATGGVLDLRQLCIDAGKVAWVAYVDIYVLDADGSVYDAALLALVAALGTLRLRAVALSEGGVVVAADDDAAGGATEQEAMDSGGGGGGGAQAPRRLQLCRMPTSLTCGLQRGRAILDLTAEEEGIVEGLVSTTIDGEANILAFLQVGGGPTGMDVLMECVEGARLRRAELEPLLAEVLA